MKDNQDYDSFRQVLKDELEWPNEYMYKFILPKDETKQKEVEALFEIGARFNYKESRTGKYISLTARAIMQSPDAVIKIYQQSGKIGGVMAL